MCVKPLDTVIFQGTEVQDNYIIVEADNKFYKSMIRCPNCSSTDIVKHGFTDKTYRDIPIDEKIVNIHLKSQKFKCKDCGIFFQIDSEDFDSNHLFTKRLFDFIVSQSQNTSIKNVAELTKIPRRTINDFKKDFMEKYLRLEVVNTVLITSIRWKSRNYYLVINGRALETIYMHSDFMQLIFFLTDLKKTHKLKHIFLPLQSDLKNKLSKYFNASMFIYNLNELRDFVSSVCYNSYLEEKNYPKNRVKIKYSDEKIENYIYFKPSNTLTVEELNLRNSLFVNNPFYKNSYLLRDIVIDSFKLSAPIYRKNYGTTPGSSLTPSSSFLDYSMNKIRKSYSKALGYRSIHQFNEQETINYLNKNNIQNMLKVLFEYPFDTYDVPSTYNHYIEEIKEFIKEDLKNKVSLDWIIYKYNKGYCDETTPDYLLEKTLPLLDMDKSKG